MRQEAKEARLGWLRQSGKNLLSAINNLSKSLLELQYAGFFHGHLNWDHILCWFLVDIIEVVEFPTNGRS